MKDYLHKVLKLFCLYGRITGMTKEGASAPLRLVFDKYSTTVRERFDTCSRQLRTLFDWPSVKLRFFFDGASTAVRERSTTLREASSMFGKFLQDASTMAARIVNPYCRDAANQPSRFLAIVQRFLLAYRLVRPMGDRTLHLGGLTLRALKPFASYLLPLKILFCVCLAHAGQRGLAIPAAAGVAFQQAYSVTGKVLSATDNVPLEGATVSIRGKQIKVLTNAEGVFRILARDTSGVLLVSFVGYQPIEVTFSRREAGPFTIHLEGNGNQLEEVQVSTGYQTLPKERATGSFVQIDNELLNRKISTNVLDRLDGVTSGLIFNKNPESRSPITIRGNSTIFGNQEPLIVLDNFPYEGSLDNINPNDIESISLLRDAAAASIWGTRAGNGVIVITTKKGREGKPKFTWNSNMNITGRPNIFARPQMSAKEYIELETFLFQQGNYWMTADGFSPISPLVEMLHQRAQGKISALDSSAFVQDLMSNDPRKTIYERVYRTGVNQQHSLSVRGGGQFNTYFLSAGYDNNNSPIVSDSYHRVNITAKNNLSFLNNRLQVATDLFLTQTSAKRNNNIYTNAIYPYEQLIDQDGRSLPVVKDLRLSYKDTVGNGRLLDWHYRPLDELSPNQTIKVTDYRFNLQTSYTISNGLSASVNYLYQKGVNEAVTENDLNSYYTRHLINRFSQIDPILGGVIRPIPLGNVVDKSNTGYENHAGRFQMNFNHGISDRHGINVLAGMELREYRSSGDFFRLFGYDPETALSGNATMDFSTMFPVYYGRSSARIPGNMNGTGTLDRNRSYFANGSYTYAGRYTLSASARRDESNIFGVATNQKGVPLWSVGGLWDIGAERFYHIDWLPSLKFRTSYGYNGNTDKTVTAYLTGRAGTAVNPFGQRFITISNPPNPSLRWEKVGVWNVALDFASEGSRINGSVEYYRKNSTDLIGDSPVSPQTGVSEFRGNTADMITRGLDIQINTKNLKGRISWNTNWLFSHVKDEVTRYKMPTSSNFNVVLGNYVNPIEGFPLFSLFGFPYGGLNGDGNPVGYLNGEESLSYSAIMNNADVQNLAYGGMGFPVFFGSMVNTLHYNNFSLSFNVLYKLGHVFRRQSLNYSEIQGNYFQADFNRRWRNPGDEQYTKVPALVYPNDLNRSNLYQYADMLIDNAGSIRLQDIRIGYTMARSAITKWPFDSLQLFAYANNVGLLWTANKSNLDPDSPNIPQARSIAFGLTANF